ncbi:Glutamate/Leucine/Phenylalanine/Valine dehydrogenase-domain-containing protein [Kockiozyma suomiensis]|uniref:Glutamate/Leucine/Phenylalanine/Valine dehydrogenase-domain-containing protein n=1 Tax=Kockiozyma suomiensis TaxID=1337062 RepID=UPI003343D21D
MPVTTIRLPQTPDIGGTPSPQPTHLSVPGSAKPFLHPELGRVDAAIIGGPHIIKESPFYVAKPFAGKEAQMEEVMDELDHRAFIPDTLIENETKWFYNSLGIDDQYFATESVNNIANHILSIYGAKVAAFSREDHKFELRLDREDEDRAVYIDTSVPGITNLKGPQYEQRIDTKYLNGSTPARAYRLETFRSVTRPVDNVTDEEPQQFRCYFVYKCEFPEGDVTEAETDMLKISDKRFYEKASENTKNIYKSVIELATSKTSGPVIDMYEIEGSRERRLIIAYRQRSASNFFSALSDLYHYYGLTSTRKYVEQFKNGVSVMCVYLSPSPKSSKYPPIEHSIHQVIKEVSLLYCLPQNLYQYLFAQGELSLQESIYAHCVTIFVTHFLNRLGSEYTSLLSILDSGNSTHQEVIAKIKRRLRQETFTKDYIVDIIISQLELVRQFYLSFASTHYVASVGEDSSFLPTLSYQRLKSSTVLSDEELTKLVSRNAANDHHVLVMSAFHLFNKHVLRTNFYTPTKVALSFRLDPSFLPKLEYPQPLFGMFLCVGQEFRGFHLRFRDIARGGIRIVKSRSQEAYNLNARSLFDENYNLANTQQRKNKDIPEGGSKGVILLDYEHQDKATVAFQKYIDAVLDLLLPGDVPGVKNKIVDLYKKEEIIFMGPDENTAGLVDWATMHARERKAPWWKSFFTGKSPELGGIPHDEYGMTSLSVREYVTGIYRKLGIDESQVRKLQTGGPDGDLGSNEILLSNEKYIAVIDGSGVLHDTNGIHREELLRLAKERKMISDFDVSKLSAEGYRVLVDEKDVTLPSGEVVENGTTFRNLFHLRSGALDGIQMFVPCGGRPEAIDANSVSALIRDGKSTIPYIVEGANLFLTQEAKLKLEAAGTIIFKDASANKGGVTSSSLEVLASLAFDDAGFYENMCISNGKVPAFYTAYVAEVQEIIKKNAYLEFEALWREHEKTGKSRSVLSDELSNAITDLTEELQNSSLWEDVEFRDAVLAEALPELLLKKITLAKILERVPVAYLKAIFGSFLAGRFVYEKGSNPGQFAFFEFMVKKRQGITT